MANGMANSKLDWTIEEHNGRFFVFLKISQPDKSLHSSLIGQGSTKFDAMLNAIDVMVETRLKLSDMLRDS